MGIDRTELVFILDKSGSMHGLEADSLGGFNAMLEKQKQLPGACKITTILFNQEISLLHDRLELGLVQSLNTKDYSVGGTTALLDALGYGIHKIAAVEASRGEGQKAANVLFVVITDGYENASREYKIEQIRQLIEMHQEKDQWTFLFLAANIDAIKTASTYGIKEEYAQDFHPDSLGVSTSYQVMSDAVSSSRLKKKIEKSWKDKLQNDFDSRK